MKLSIRTIISIVIIAISSISFVQAEQHRSDRGYDRSHEKPRHYRQNERRHHWKRSAHRSNHYRAQRHSYGSYYRKHQGYNRQHRSYRRVERHGYRHTTYVTPYYVAPSHSSPSIVVTSSSHALPVLAGGLIGSAIANDMSDGDPVATFGGAVFGAIVGNAIARH
jgi:hypothetical protein